MALAGCPFLLEDRGKGCRGNVRNRHSIQEVPHQAFPPGIDFGLELGQDLSSPFNLKRGIILGFQAKLPGPEMYLRFGRHEIRLSRYICYEIP